MGWTNGEDIFGDVDGLIREQRGWLTEEVIRECLTMLPSFHLTFQGKQGRIWDVGTLCRVKTVGHHWNIYAFSKYIAARLNITFSWNFSVFICLLC